MATVFMTDPATGRVAFYDEPTTSGSITDPNSARNAPLNSPTSNLQYIYYHSDFDPMELLASPYSISVNHDLIPTATDSTDRTVAPARYDTYTDNYAVLNHGLGYVPDFFIVSGGDTIHPGFPIQYNTTNGAARYITPYATTSEIRFYEVGAQTSVALPAITISYSLIVLKRPPAPSGTVLFEFEPVSGVTTMARGKFSSDRQYLQVTGGATVFSLPLGRTIDLNNGTSRSVSSSSTRDPVPDDVAVALIRLDTGAFVFGPSANYKGSFVGDPFLGISAP